ncbi:MAG: hypothetical protein CFE35_14945 [Novosphingobium sp. PASSN1]|nr:MAG: hypothetical protein CFE35_14945 [Novosphingobium sp. PASSN1]
MHIGFRFCLSHRALSQSSSSIIERITVRVLNHVRNKADVYTRPSPILLPQIGKELSLANPYCYTDRAETTTL